MIYYLQKIILCISALAVLGASIQYILTKIDDIRYPAPGEMVDIGGYRLHIQTMGVGDGPTIVLDMGIGGNLLYWSLVQSEVAKFAKVVSYDRAGIGWSDTSPLPRTGENIVKELRSLLHNAKIPGPYILVGHSFAGVNARLYANKYPDEVAGIVLVDSSHEDQLEDLPKPTDFLSNLLDAPRIYPLVIALTRVGLVRLFNLYNGESDMFDQETRSIMVAKNSSTKFIKAFLVEWGLFEQNLIEAKMSNYSLGNIPLIVVTASMSISEESCAKHGHLSMDACVKAHEIWHSLQSDLVTKSTNSKQIRAYNSGHIIQRDEPAVVIEAVRQILGI